MKVGERAIIKCTANYAYGSAGIIPVIPPDAAVDLGKTIPHRFKSQLHLSQLTQNLPQMHAAVDLDVKVVAWLGNQLRPETLFQKDLVRNFFHEQTPFSLYDLTRSSCTEFVTLILTGYRSLRCKYSRGDSG